MNGTQPEFIGGVVADYPTRTASESDQNPNGVIVVTRAEELRCSNCLQIGTTGEYKSYEDQILQAYREYRLENSGVEGPAWSASRLPSGPYASILSASPIALKATAGCLPWPC